MKDNIILAVDNNGKKITTKDCEKYLFNSLIATKHLILVLSDTCRSIIRELMDIQ